MEEEDIDYANLSSEERLVLMILYRNGGEMCERDVEREFFTELNKHGSIDAAIAEVAKEIRPH